MEANILHIFERARNELFCPPCTLSTVSLKDAPFLKESLIFVSDGVVYLNLEKMPKRCDLENFLLWSFRHEISHVHFCPYNARTALSLQKAAYDVTRDWDLAYLSLLIFSDLQIDLAYLPSRFHETPYHIEATMNSRRPRGVAELLYAAYKQIYPRLKGYRINDFVVDCGRQIAGIIKSREPWPTQIKMIAKIIQSLKYENPVRFRLLHAKSFIKGRKLSLREDFQQGSSQQILEQIHEVYGKVKDEREAKALFNQWLGSRLERRAKERPKIKLNVKGIRKRRGGGFRRGAEPKPTTPSRKPTGATTPQDSPLKFPTSFSEHLHEVPKRLLAEAGWKRFWYRARAENVMVKYFEEGGYQRPRFSVMSYPDEWHVDDEVEELDLETSLDEGPIIPEVTTLKWIERAAEHAASMALSSIPATIIVLDSSLSMAEAFDDAATSAFIFLSAARKAGGQTSAICFSKEYVEADWGKSEEEKELALSLQLGGWTILPIQSIEELTHKLPSYCIIIIITDCGWQNFVEVLPRLEMLSQSDHKIIILRFKGENHYERLEELKDKLKIKIYNIQKPEEDLQKIIIPEALKSYTLYHQ